jgi:hypothetical protein
MAWSGMTDVRRLKGMTKRATREGCPCCDMLTFPSSLQMPHDGAWDGGASSCFALRSSHSDWAAWALSPGPMTGYGPFTQKCGEAKHDKPHLQPDPANRSPRTRACSRGRPIGRGRMQAQAHAPRSTVGVSKGTLPPLHHPPTATQAKGRLRPSGCVLLAGTPQQRPSVSAHRHPALTCCERCC